MPDTAPPNYAQHQAERVLATFQQDPSSMQRLEQFIKQHSGLRPKDYENNTTTLSNAVQNTTTNNNYHPDPRFSDPRFVDTTSTSNQQQHSTTSSAPNSARSPHFVPYDGNKSGNGGEYPYYHPGSGAALTTSMAGTSLGSHAARNATGTSTSNTTSSHAPPGLAAHYASNAGSTTSNGKGGGKGQNYYYYGYE